MTYEEHLMANKSILNDSNYELVNGKLKSVGINNDDLAKLRKLKIRRIT